jgi:SAM-dependent methyltransferase
MSSRTRRRTVLASLPVFLAITLCSAPARAAPQAPLPPTATPEEVRVYETFRAWITSQPAELQRADDDVVFQRYAAALESEGKSQKEAASTIALLQKIGDRAEVERWNRILTAPRAGFSMAPNGFLVEMIKGLRPGRALDVGMGQGRNTIFLAQQGWEAVGFDPADRAVAAAQAQAARSGVKITTHVARAEDFDWGVAQWDLIVLSYVGAREYVADVLRALRPGGMVLIEGFHRDATKIHPIGGAVVFDTNELLMLYGALRVVRYEDTDGIGDFGLEHVRLVRLFAQKP